MGKKIEDIDELFNKIDELDMLFKEKSVVITRSHSFSKESSHYEHEGEIIFFNIEQVKDEMDVLKVFIYFKDGAMVEEVFILKDFKLDISGKMITLKDNVISLLLL